MGFIPSDRKNDPIAMGISFVDDLISRSFFQIKLNRGSNKILTMHDLIHDLASLIAGNECFTLQNNASTDVLFSSHLRHLYGCPFVPINTQFALRSFYYVSNLESGYLTGLIKRKENNIFADLTGLIKSGILQYLKVLDISKGCPPYLCESIGYFKHLRYVSFSQPKIPESVCLLYNLETLQNKLGGFVESQLPMDLCWLISLKHLIVPSYSVNLIPVGISRLRNLQTLSVFAVCHDNHGASLAELKELNNLKRKFCITQLHHLTCDRTTEAEEACLSKKEQLTHLTLDWTYVPVSASISHEQVLNYLRPHTGIQTIEICNYSGRMYPDWLGDRQFSRISTVKLTSCYYCEKLPSLGELPCLKHLYLSNMPELKCIGSEFYGNSNVSFPLLETLRFGHMPDWAEWWTGEGDANLFPCLVNLELVGCSMLNKSFSVINMPSLKTVSVGHCDKLTIEGRESHPHLQVNKWINYTWKCI
ncbi:hypothetical protein LUZ60_004018 [Juncus effusus]|nr:hypothetical protein LUZ60_004018 [Juncus effusus]